MKSEINKGLQRFGRTKLDSNILLEKIGDLKIKVNAGIFTTPDGFDININEKVFKLKNDKDVPKQHSIVIYDREDPKLGLEYNFIDENEEIDSRKNDVIHRLIGFGWGLELSPAQDVLGEVKTLTPIDNKKIESNYGERPSDPMERKIIVGDMRVSKINHFARRKGEGGKIALDENNKLVLNDIHETLSKDETKLEIHRGKELSSLKNCDETIEESWAKNMSEKQFNTVMRRYYPNKNKRKEKIKRAINELS